MNDRPTAAELIDAVRGYLEKELLPALTDARLRFQTLVAANVLAIAGRELATEADSLEEEWTLLDGLLGPVEKPARGLREAVERRNRELCERIRVGSFDEAERLREVTHAAADCSAEVRGGESAVSGGVTASGFAQSREAASGSHGHRLAPFRNPHATKSERPQVAAPAPLTNPARRAPGIRGDCCRRAAAVNGAGRRDRRGRRSRSSPRPRPICSTFGRENAPSGYARAACAPSESGAW